jgi:hypothetical protein
MRSEIYILYLHQLMQWIHEFGTTMRWRRVENTKMQHNEQDNLLVVWLRDYADDRDSLVSDAEIDVTEESGGGLGEMMILLLKAAPLIQKVTVPEQMASHSQIGQDTRKCFLRWVIRLMELYQSGKTLEGTQWVAVCTKEL